MQNKPQHIDYAVAFLTLFDFRYDMFSVTFSAENQESSEISLLRSF